MRRELIMLGGSTENAIAAEAREARRPDKEGRPTRTAIKGKGKKEVKKYVY